MPQQPAFDDDYVPVAERIRQFREKYPEGSLRPLDPNHPFRLAEVGGQTYVSVTTAAFRHPLDPAPGVGTAWQIMPGTTEFTLHSEVMVAETSSWGRAIIATLAADASKSVASREEVRAAQANRTRPQQINRTVAEPVNVPIAAAPSTHAVEDDEGNRELIAETLKLILDPKATSGELRDVWQVLSQARLLAWRVDPSDGMEPDGDGKVPIGSLVAFVGKQRRAEASE